MRIILYCFVCSLTLCGGSWDDLRQIGAGSVVSVQDTAGRDYRGKFTAVTPAAISLATDSGPAGIERTRVRRVKVRVPSRRARNIAIGVGIGFAVGLVVDQTLGTYFRNESNQTDAARAITYVAPIGIFGALGAAIAPWRTAYRSH